MNIDQVVRGAKDLIEEHYEVHNNDAVLRFLPELDELARLAKIGKDYETLGPFLMACEKINKGEYQ